MLGVNKSLGTGENNCMLFAEMQKHFMPGIKFEGC